VFLCWRRWDHRLVPGAGEEGLVVAVVVLVASSSSNSFRNSNHNNKQGCPYQEW
jgi:hypothetical protein